MIPRMVPASSSALMNENVSIENVSVSSSAYTSKSLGKFNRPSANRCMTLVGERANSSLGRFGSGMADHSASVEYAVSGLRRG